MPLLLLPDFFYLIPQVLRLREHPNECAVITSGKEIAVIAGNRQTIDTSSLVLVHPYSYKYDLSRRKVVAPQIVNARCRFVP